MNMTRFIDLTNLPKDFIIVGLENQDLQLDMFQCGSDFFCFVHYMLVDQTGDVDFSATYESNWNYYGTDRIYSDGNSFSACGQLKFEIF